MEITQRTTRPAPAIPVHQGQIVLYDAVTCKVVKAWTPAVEPDGTATGDLPTDGDFIIGVKYNPSALKGKASACSDDGRVLVRNGAREASRSTRRRSTSSRRRRPYEAASRLSGWTIRGGPLEPRLAHSPVDRA